MGPMTPVLPTAPLSPVGPTTPLPPVLPIGPWLPVAPVDPVAPRTLPVKEEEPVDREEERLPVFFGGMRAACDGRSRWAPLLIPAIWEKISVDTKSTTMTDPINAYGCRSFL